MLIIYPGTSTSILLPPLLLNDVIIVFLKMLLFRVLHVVSHTVMLNDVQAPDLNAVTMYVYTDRSVVVLSAFPLAELLYEPNFLIIYRYFANLYVNSVLGTNIWWV